MLYECPLYHRLGTDYVPLPDGSLPQERQSLHHQPQDSYGHNASYVINQPPVTGLWHLSSSPVRGGHSPPIAMKREVPTLQRGRGNENLIPMSRSTRMPPNAHTAKGQLSPRSSSKPYVDTMLINENGWRPLQEDNLPDISSGFYTRNFTPTEVQGHQLSRREQEFLAVGQGHPSRSSDYSTQIEERLYKLIDVIENFMLNQQLLNPSEILPTSRYQLRKDSSLSHKQDICEEYPVFDATYTEPKRQAVEDIRCYRNDSIELQTHMDRFAEVEVQPQGHQTSRSYPRSFMSHGYFKNWPQEEKHNTFQILSPEEEAASWIQEHRYADRDNMKSSNEKEDLIGFDEIETCNEHSKKSQDFQEPDESFLPHQSQGHLCNDQGQDELTISKNYLIVHQTKITEKYEEDDRGMEEYSQNLLTSYLLNTGTKNENSSISDNEFNSKWFLPTDLFQDPECFDELVCKNEENLPETSAFKSFHGPLDECQHVQTPERRDLYRQEEGKDLPKEMNEEVSPDVASLVAKAGLPEPMGNESDDHELDPQDVKAEDEETTRVVHFVFKKEYIDPKHYDPQKSYFHLQPSNGKRRCYLCQQRTHFAPECPLLPPRKRQR